MHGLWRSLIALVVFFTICKGIVSLGQAHVVRLNHPDMSTLELEGIASSLQCENSSEVSAAFHSGCESVFKTDMELIKYVINYSFLCNMSFMLRFEHNCSMKLILKQYT